MEPRRAFPELLVLMGDQRGFFGSRPTVSEAAGDCRAPEAWFSSAFSKCTMPCHSCCSWMQLARNSRNIGTLLGCSHGDIHSGNGKSRINDGFSIAKVDYRAVPSPSLFSECCFFPCKSWHQHDLGQPKRVNFYPRIPHPLSRSHVCPFRWRRLCARRVRDFAISTYNDGPL